MEIDPKDKERLFAERFVPEFLVQAQHMRVSDEVLRALVSPEGIKIIRRMFEAAEAEYATLPTFVGPQESLELLPERHVRLTVDYDAQFPLFSQLISVGAVSLESIFTRSWQQISPLPEQPFRGKINQVVHIASDRRLCESPLNFEVIQKLGYRAASLHELITFVTAYRYSFPWLTEICAHGDWNAAISDQNEQYFPLIHRNSRSGTWTLNQIPHTREILIASQFFLLVRCSPSK